MAFKILVFPAGSREHAMVETALRTSGRPLQIYCVSKTVNPGILRRCKDTGGEYIQGDPNDAKTVLKAAKKHSIDLVAVGNEDPITVENAVVDLLEDKGIACMGPRSGPGQLETDKAFFTKVMQRPGLSKYIPKSASFTDARSAVEYIDRMESEGVELALKYAGLMGGKGVKVMGVQLSDYDEAREYAQEIFSSDGFKARKLVIQEKVSGIEFSHMSFTDGKTIVPMPLVRDHKLALEGDELVKGNKQTGGMGTYSRPDHLLPGFPRKTYDDCTELNRKILKAVKRETGQDYKGIMYQGNVLFSLSSFSMFEMNCRGGAPESEDVLPLLESDVVEIWDAIAHRELKKGMVEFASKAVVCKMVAHRSYVDAGYPKGSGILYLDEDRVKRTGSILYYASVDYRDGKIYTTPSRALAVVNAADTIEEADANVEKAIREGVNFEKPEEMYWRRDIGKITHDMHAAQMAGLPKK